MGVGTLLSLSLREERGEREREREISSWGRGNVYSDSSLYPTLGKLIGSGGNVSDGRLWREGVAFFEHEVHGQDVKDRDGLGQTELRSTWLKVTDYIPRAEGDVG